MILNNYIGFGILLKHLLFYVPVTDGKGIYAKEIKTQLKLAVHNKNHYYFSEKHNIAASIALHLWAYKIYLLYRAWSFCQ